MELKKIIGQKIRELRKARGLTQAALAAFPELGISQASLAAYEIGAREPSMETIAAIAHFFHVTIDSLFDETERPEGAGLSDRALDFLAICDAELLATVDAVLSSEAATGFFEDLRAYVMACCPDPEDLAELLPMADHLNRDAGADRVALDMLTSYKRKLLDRALDELCEELARAAGPGGSSEITKGGTHYGNSSKTRG
jgi:transcriptional regulator with XRE-family HTH domain